MAAVTTDDGQATGVNLERELVCFICTEIYYRPLTLLDCLHSFCGSCLKIWFAHQHKKATSSHPAAGAPYTCPTCRAPVKDTQRNSMVNTVLESFLAVNPGRVRSAEEKEEMDETYKPGDNILPKIEDTRRRERRTRRDEDAVEARERRLLEEARERSLRDAEVAPRERRGNHHHQQHLRQPQQEHASRSRERRREQERQEQRDRGSNAERSTGQAQRQAEEQQRRENASGSPPISSPRNPEAVEARQRQQQTVTHQASLASLISASENSTGDDERVAELMREVLALGILEDIDPDSLNETEQTLLANRVAEMITQSRLASSQAQTTSEGRSNNRQPRPGQERSGLRPQDASRDQRQRSNSGQRRADTMPHSSRDDTIVVRPRSARTHPVEGSTPQPPPSAMATMPAQTRRTSDHSQQRSSSRTNSRQSSPAGRSAHSQSRSHVDLPDRSSNTEPQSAGRHSRSNTGQRTPVVLTGSARVSETNQHNPNTHYADSPATLSPQNVLAELAANEPSTDRKRFTISTQSAAPSNSQTVRSYTEPSVMCLRCSRSDIQYDVHKHCDRCNVDLCLRCYREGKGCHHWFGFGRAAIPKFESSQADRLDSEAVDLPHMLFGRQYRRPDTSTILERKTTVQTDQPIALRTSSDPTTRLQEGNFCDRCGKFENACFWSCDDCNDGEWGFCKECVNTHHCCTHPLLPVAHKSCIPSPAAQRPKHDTNIASVNLAPVELHSTALQPSPVHSRPSSARSNSSAMVGPLPDFVNLTITTHCDICSAPVPPSQSRFHCPFHSSPDSTNPSSDGDYDICSSCYHNFVHNNHIKREDGPSGWRRCPSGHRMIVTAFESDAEGFPRRVVLNDLVGGWKMTEEDMTTWNQAIAQREQQNVAANNSNNPGHISPPVSSPKGTWTWIDDATSNRRATRARTNTMNQVTASSTTSPTSPHATLSNINGSNISSSSTNSSTTQQPIKFPPDSGFGARGIAAWSYYPEEGEGGKGEISFPKWAEIREIEDINGVWFEGVYAGDIGLGPSAYVRL